MRLLSIKTENFRLHADTDVTFPEDSVIGIVGTNESGKSTLATEAVLWAFYGGKAIRGTKEGIRWNRAPARHTASVIVRFEIGGTVYRVERGESNATLYEDDTDKVLSQGTAPVNKAVPALIGMAHDEFIASYLVKQKDVTRIASMLPTERQAFVRKVMGVGRIDAALKSCRSKKSDLSKEIAGMEAGLGQRDPLVEALHQASEDRAKAVKWHEAAAVTEGEAKEALDRAKAVFEEADLLRSTCVDLNASRDTALRRATEAEESLATEEERAERQQEAVPFVEQAKARLKALPGLREEARALVGARTAAIEYQKAQERLKDLERKKEQAEREARAAQKIIDEYDAEAHTAARTKAKDLHESLEKMRKTREANRERKLASADQAMKEAQVYRRKAETLEELGADTGCPTCTRPLGEHFEAVVGHLYDQVRLAENHAEDARLDADMFSEPGDAEVEVEIELREIQNKIERFDTMERKVDVAKVDIRRLDVRCTEIRSESDNLYQADPPETDFDQARLEENEAKIRDLEALAESQNLTQARSLVAGIEETQERIRTLTERRDENFRKVTKLDQDIEALHHDPNVYEQEQEALRIAMEESNDARVAVARAEQAEKDATRQVQHATSALEAYDKRAERLNEVKTDHLTHERTAARLADFRVAIAATIRPEMEELMSGFVHLLTDGRHEAVELSEDFAATLYESGVPVETVSGGTEDIVALAMRLALSQMIAERAGHPLSLLILDEPFGSLDETRRGNVLTLIRQLKTVFRQVLVISHVAETRDAVDHVIEFEFNEGRGMTEVVA